MKNILLIGLVFLVNLTIQAQDPMSIIGKWEYVKSYDKEEKEFILSKEENKLPIRLQFLSVKKHHSKVSKRALDLIEGDYLQDVISYHDLAYGYHKDTVSFPRTYGTKEKIESFTGLKGLNGAYIEHLSSMNLKGVFNYQIITIASNELVLKYSFVVNKKLIDVYNIYRKVN